MGQLKDDTREIDERIRRLRQDSASARRPGRAIRLGQDGSQTDVTSTPTQVPAYTPRPVSAPMTD